MLTAAQIAKLEELGFVKNKYWFKSYFIDEEYRRLNVVSGSIQVQEVHLFGSKNSQTIYEAHLNSAVYDQIQFDLLELAKVGIR